MPPRPRSEEHSLRNPWHGIIRDALCETPGLVWVFPEAAVPGATLWRAMRGWVECLRGLGIAPGDRVVLAGTPGFGWVGAALAGLWLEATLVPLPGGAEAAAVEETLDARLVIGPGGQVTWNEHGAPQVRAALRPMREGARAEARLLMRTSGTGGAARWIALSDANVLAVLDSHVPALGLDRTHRLLSTLPWSHAFGLVLECLAALRARASLVRCAAPADAAAQVRLARAWKLDWWCAVPAMVRALAATPDGPMVLAALRGGIVGGAALSAETCARLAGTRLRVGYGQTEAAPGIMLGAPGEFLPDFIGRPVGCDVRIAEGGGIEFSGANACLGRWPLTDASEWRDTGDLGREAGGAYFFAGRRDDLIRLDNGRTLSALACERRLRELCPGAGNLMLWSPDGLRLELACAGDAPGDAVLAECLGALAGRVQVRPRLRSEDWRLTAKGEIDRVALRRQFSPS